jgi:uncharacterized protein YjiS (DUF1127 family)
MHFTDTTADGSHALRASCSSTTSRAKLSMRRRVCSYLLWRLQRSEMTLLRRLGNLDDERLEALGISRHEIEAMLTATRKVLAQAASEPRARPFSEGTVRNAPGSR